ILNDISNNTDRNSNDRNLFLLSVTKSKTYSVMKLFLLTIVSLFSCCTVQAQSSKKESIPASSLPIRTLSADFTKVKGPMNKMFNQCIGAGRANEGLRADWQ